MTLNEDILLVIKQVFRNAIIRSLIFFGNHDKNSFVLSYHDVDKEYKLTPGIFEYQFKYYMKHGYRFVSNIEDLRPHKRILVTFDDGYNKIYQKQDKKLVDIAKNKLGI